RDSHRRVRQSAATAGRSRNARGGGTGGCHPPATGADDYRRHGVRDDSAADRRHPGRSAAESTAAMVFAMIPLLIAQGAGAVSRFDIGVVIASGLTVGTLFTLFVLPAVYVTFSERDRTA